MAEIMNDSGQSNYDMYQLDENGEPLLDEEGNPILREDYGDTIDNPAIQDTQEGFGYRGYGEGNYRMNRGGVGGDSPLWQEPNSWKGGWDNLMQKADSMRNQLINPGNINQPPSEESPTWWDILRSPQDKGQQVPAIEESLINQDILDA